MHILSNNGDVDGHSWWLLLCSKRALLSCNLHTNVKCRSKSISLYDCSIK